jgi:hypothetical protein
MHACLAAAAHVCLNARGTAVLQPLRRVASLAQLLLRFFASDLLV